MKKLNNVNLKAFFILFAIFSAIFFLFILFYGDHFNGNALTLLLIALFIWLAMLICGIAYKLYSEILQNRYVLRYVHRQVESMLSIHSLTRATIPMPNTGDWAATADLVAQVYKNILVARPKIIVELGSGASSIYISQLIKDQSLDCFLHSIDHSEHYGQETSIKLGEYRLNEFAKVHYAPLKQFPIKGKNWQWYDKQEISKINDIDLLIVDGPITYLQKESRFPAVPLLWDNLSPGCIIIVDDYKRKDEGTIVKKWLLDYDLELIEEIDSEKGTAVLKKKL